MFSSVAPVTSGFCCGLVSKLGQATDMLSGKLPSRRAPHLKRGLDLFKPNLQINELPHLGGERGGGRFGGGREGWEGEGSLHQSIKNRPRGRELQ